MKKIYALVLAIMLSVVMMGCANKTDMSWARIELVGDTGAYLYTSQEGDIHLYKEDGTVLFQKDDLLDGMYEIYAYGVAYVNQKNELILVSGVSGDSKLCDMDVSSLDGEVYGKKNSHGYLVLAYEVTKDGDIVSSNLFPEK